MAKIVVDYKDILVTSPCDEKEPFKCDLIKYLPRDKSGGICASTDGNIFQSVPVCDLWANPIIAIDYHNTDDENCSGPSDKGITMLAFQKKVTDIDEFDIELKHAPSFVTLYGDCLQMVFVLYKFMPSPMSGRSMQYFEFVTERLEKELYAENVNKIFNPCCPDVTAWLSNSNHKHRFSLKDLHLISDVANLRSAEIYLNRIEADRKNRAKGGIAAAAVRKAKSIGAIREVIDGMNAMGERLNQGTVASRVGLSRKTVNKNWSECIP